MDELNRTQMRENIKEKRRSKMVINNLVQEMKRNLLKSMSNSNFQSIFGRIKKCIYKTGYRKFMVLLPACFLNVRS